jgi:hypothetical protein
MLAFAVANIGRRGNGAKDKGGGQRENERLLHFLFLVRD